MWKQLVIPFGVRLDTLLFELYKAREILENLVLRQRLQLTIYWLYSDYGTILYNTAHYSTIQYSRVQYSTVYYSTVQYI